MNLSPFSVFSLLPGDAAHVVHPYVENALLAPLTEFLQRPSKRFRADLVRLAFYLARTQGESQSGSWEPGAELLESLHAGSLVVDDIQDDSLFRRGGPTLHRLHGVAAALNAGNWLYFWPLERVREWGLRPEQECDIYRVCHQALLAAHFGQAIDVGVSIDTVPQHEVSKLCLASLELKTGALMALAMSIGAILAGASAQRRLGLERFGKEFGIALQMFDDLGNLSLSAKEKRFEDLTLRRPCWPWAVAAGSLSPTEYEGWVKAVAALPAAGSLEHIVATYALTQKGYDEARQRLSRSLAELCDEYGEVKELFELKALAERLTGSYG